MKIKKIVRQAFKKIFIGDGTNFPIDRLMYAVFILSVPIILYVIYVEFSPRNYFISTPSDNIVRISNLDIENTVDGILVKSMVEIEFYNPHSKDILEASFEININKSCFIKNLWLDIKGKYKTSETFQALTGRTIYERVTGKDADGRRRNLDPALLIKISEGKYRLRVYPFKPGEKRKVKLEMYSVLEPDMQAYNWSIDLTNLNLDWNDEYEFPVNIRMNNNSVPGADYITRRRYNSYKRNDFDEHRKAHYFDVDFNIPKQDSVIYKITDGKYDLYFNNILNFDPNDLISLNLSKYDLQYRQPSSLAVAEKIFKSIYSDKILYLDNNYLDFTKENNNAFFIGLETYLNKTHDKKIFYGDKENFYWNMKNSVFSYEKRNGNYVLLSSENTDPEKRPVILKSAFVSEFFNNFISSKKDLKSQVEDECLTVETVKLVLEDEKRVNQIRDEELKIERNDPIGIMECQMAPPEIEAAEMIGGFIKFYSILKYPVECKSDTAYVILKFRIDSLGYGTGLKVIKEYPECKGLAEITIQTLKMTEFIQSFNPGYKGWPYKFDPEYIISIPFKKEVCGNRFTKYFDKEFKISFIDGKYLPLEKGYNISKAIHIEFASDEYYDLIKDNMELLKYLISFPDIGFVHKNNSYLISSKIVPEKSEAGWEYKELLDNGLSIFYPLLLLNSWDYKIDEKIIPYNQTISKPEFFEKNKNEWIKSINDKKKE